MHGVVSFIVGDLKFSFIVLSTETFLGLYLQVLVTLLVIVEVTLLEAATHLIPQLLWKRSVSLSLLIYYSHLIFHQKQINNFWYCFDNASDLVPVEITSRQNLRSYYNLIFQKLNFLIFSFLKLTSEFCQTAPKAYTFLWFSCCLLIKFIYFTTPYLFPGLSGEKEVFHFTIRRKFWWPMSQHLEILASWCRMLVISSV